MNTSKYDPLKSYLNKQSLDRVPMGFKDIEKLLGFTLPKSSRNHRAWWSNNPSNSVITYAWLSAGYETSEVDMAAERLTFRKALNLPRMAAMPATTMPTRTSFSGSAKPSLFGALKGMVTVKPGTDLTASSDPDWDSADDN